MKTEAEIVEHLAYLAIAMKAHLEDKEPKSEMEEKIFKSMVQSATVLNWIIDKEDWNVIDVRYSETVANLKASMPESQLLSPR